MKYLNFYAKCCKNGRLPGRGLCGSLLPDPLLFEMFEQGDGSYWAHENGKIYEERAYPYDMAKSIRHEFTPLRQNIVLLLACLNGEL